MKLGITPDIKEISFCCQFFSLHVDHYNDVCALCVLLCFCMLCACVLI